MAVEGCEDIYDYAAIYRVATGQRKVREIQGQGKVREF